MWVNWANQLPPAAHDLLLELAAGATLKAHRTLDGDKRHELHRLTGERVPIAATTVRTLERRRLLASNMKFPAATYLLTEQGIHLARSLCTPPTTPLTIRK